MRSDTYIYYTIQSDESYSKKVETKIIVDILGKMKYFKQINHQTFCNSETCPWFDLCLFEANKGNYSVSDDPIPFVNLITFVGRKEVDFSQEVYIQILKDIAQKLSRKVYLEEDDNGNDNIEIK